MLLKYTFVFFLGLYLSPSYSVVMKIPDPQTKNQKSADLAEVQLQDVEAYQKENKLNENGDRILRRRIFSTDPKLIANSTVSVGNTSTEAIKIASEGSGVTKLVAVSNNSSNNTAETVVAAHDHLHKSTNDTKIATNTTKRPTINSTLVMEKKPKETNVPVKTTPTPRVMQNSTTAVVSVNSTTNSSTTVTTTSTTTTTTTTTTPKPRKPTITYSLEDMPEIANVAPQQSPNGKIPSDSKPSSTKLSVDEPEQPIAQPSQEFDHGLYRNHRDYIIPIVSIIFAVPILMGMVIVAYRRFRDFWSTRHYRRMDFLVDGMYND